MKIVILGVISAFLVVYTTISGLGVYNVRARYGEMETTISQVVKQHLERGYGQGNFPMWEEQLVEDLRYRFGSDSDVEIEVHCLDYEKGIISVTVSESFVQLNGQTKLLEWTKTGIMDRKVVDIVTDQGVKYK